MDDQRHAHRFKCRSGQLGAVRRGGGWHGRTFHMRKIHACLFEHRALFQYAAFAASQMALPMVGNECRAAFLRFQCGANVVLQLPQYRQNVQSIHVLS